MSSDEEFVPLNLWIRDDQMETIVEDAYNQSTTIYTLIRNIIDYYYENQRSSNEETNSHDRSSEYMYTE